MVFVWSQGLSIFIDQNILITFFTWYRVYHRSDVLRKPVFSFLCRTSWTFFKSIVSNYSAMSNRPLTTPAFLATNLIILTTVMPLKNAGWSIIKFGTIPWSRGAKYSCENNQSTHPFYLFLVWNVSPGYWPVAGRRTTLSEHSQNHYWTEVL